MDLSLYKETPLESRIANHYQKCGINYAHEMDIDYIAEIFNAAIHTHLEKPKVMYNNDSSLIFLYAYADKVEKRESFFHELSHAALHWGDQNKLPPLLVELQEIQAGHFQGYAAIPAYLLREFEGIENRNTYIKVIAEEFGVSIPFARRRIEQIERRIVQAKIDNEIIEQRNQPHIATAPIKRPEGHIEQVLARIMEKRRIREEREREGYYAIENYG